MRRELERLIENFLLDLRRNPIGVGFSRPAFFLEQSLDATDLECTPNLVERVAVQCN